MLRIPQYSKFIKKRRQTLIILLILLPLFLISVILIQKQERQQVIAQATPTPTIIYSHKKLVITRNEKVIKNTAYEIAINNMDEDPLIVRFGDHLFFRYRTVGLTRYNIKTGESVDYQIEPNHAVDSIVLIDKTIYFTTRTDKLTYTGDSAMYMLNPSSDQSPKKLFSSPGHFFTIKKHSNYYVLTTTTNPNRGVGGTDDNEQIALFDSKTNTKKSFIPHNDDTTVDEYGRFIDIDKRGNVLKIVFSSGVSDDDSVISLSLENPGKREYIIAPVDMPDKIRSASYDREHDRLLLFGEELYIYDFNTKKLSNIAKLPRYINYRHIASKDLICIKNDDGILGMHVDTKRVNYNEKICEKSFPWGRTSEDYEKDIEDFKKSLNLPAEYEYTLVES